jgi:hypothetical protein
MRDRWDGRPYRDPCICIFVIAPSAKPWYAGRRPPKRNSATLPLCHSATLPLCRLSAERGIAHCRVRGNTKRRAQKTHPSMYKKSRTCVKQTSFPYGVQKLTFDSQFLFKILLVSFSRYSSFARLQLRRLIRPR